MASEREALLAAFTPNAVIDEPGRFAGRREQIALGIDALNTAGSLAAIYGPRGVGKTSLAHQLVRLATGDTALFGSDGSSNGHPRLFSSYHSVYVVCPQTAPDSRGLLGRTRREIAVGITSGYADPGTGVAPKPGGFSARFFGRGLGRSVSNEDLGMSLFGAGEDELLTWILKRHRREFQRPALIVYDEVDVMPDISGLAQYMKTVDPELATFMLVGVASTAEQLVHDHESIGRSLRPIELPAMSEPEIQEIFAIAHQRLRSENAQVTFSAEAIDVVCEQSGGFPYVVQAIGLEAGLSCVRRGGRSVKKEDVSKGFLRFSSTEFVQIREAAYRTAVRDSRDRDSFLTACADRNQNDIPFRELSRDLREEPYLLSNPSQTLSELMKEESGPVFLRVPGAPNFIRFRDPYLKWYIRRRTRSS